MTIFTTNSLEAAKNDYNKVQLEPEQNLILNDLAEILASEIEVDILPLKGFMLRGIRQWQAEHDIKIAELIQSDPAVRRQHIRNMFDNLKKIMHKGLKNKLDETKLDKAIDSAFETYSQKYSER